MTVSPDNTTVAVATLGCKVNQCETAAIRCGFEDRGLAVTPFSRPADLYVINTCAVTARAAAQSRQLIRRARRANPGARIVVTGCYAQVAAEELAGLDGQSLRIVGNDRKQELVSLALADFAEERDEISRGDIGAVRTFQPLPVREFGNRTRAFLKIQDGCNNFCSYCIVPLARGRGRSLPPDRVLSEARRLVEHGYREVVVTGIHIGHYGRDLQDGEGLFALLRRLTKQLPRTRFRLSSLEPAEIGPDFLGFLAETANLMPHLHIPLQSGDDRILQRMRRRYRCRDFARLVTEFTGRLPEAAVGVDVLTGFPGEDHAAFANTRALLKDLPLAYLHVFPYSRRPGTPAADYSGQVPKGLKEERTAVLRKLDNSLRLAFRGRHLGTEREVLAEGFSGRDRLLHGFTDNYIRVGFRAGPGLTNQIVTVRLEKLQEKGVRGTLISP